MKIYSISVEYPDGRIVEVCRRHVFHVLDERPALTRITDDLYRLQHKLSGEFVGEMQKCFKAPSGEMYYISHDNEPSAINDMPHDADRFDKWHKEYLLANETATVAGNNQEDGQHRFECVECEWTFTSSGQLMLWENGFQKYGCCPQCGGKSLPI